MISKDREYAFLDAIAVIISLLIVGGIIVGLFIYELDPAVAPIVSSLATALLGIPVAYGAFRWGGSVGSKRASDAAAETSRAATGALAQLAGAGPPPPHVPTIDPAATDEGPQPSARNL